MANYSKSELARAKFVKEQELYSKEGYKKAAFLGRSLNDYENHLFAYLIDLSICLLPVYVWGIEFILILAGVIPPTYFDLLFYIMYTLLFVMSCILLPLYTAAKGGYSWGGRMMGLRLVSPSKKPAPAMRLVLRELCGIGAPMMIFGYFFSVFGILIWWAVNGLCVLISPDQRTIFDYIFSLVDVYVPRYGMKIVGEDETAAKEETKGASARSKSAQAESPMQKQSAKPAGRTASKTANRQTSTRKASSKKSPTSANAGAAGLKEDAAAVSAAALSASTQASTRNADRVKEEEPQPSSIDLHIRSNYSDDSDLEVEDIFRMARDKGLDVISITDHNNARANAQAVRFASLYGIRYIPGVEIDCELDGERLRILGYYIDWNDPFFDEIERASLKREKDVSMARIRLFEKAAGLKVDSDALLSNSRFKLLHPRELTALVFDTPDARTLPSVACYLNSAKSEAQARERFLQDYFGEGGRCEIRVHYPDALDVIDAIHNAGGLAILAGWHISRLSDDVLGALLNGGLDGVEAFSPDNSPEDVEFLVSLAAEEKAFVTAGSDYHGSRKKNRWLGVSGMPPKGENIVRIFTRSARGRKAYK